MTRKKAPKKNYRRELSRLQVGLVTLQRHIIEHGHKLLVVLEGRDAAGKTQQGRMASPSA